MKICLALILGGWLAGTLIVGGVATENFFTIDRLLSSPTSHASFQKDVSALPAGEARVLLRYVSSELNRLYFTAWGWVQLGFALAALLLALAGTQHRKFIFGFGIMLGLSVTMAFYLTPRITQVGRGLDFVPRQPPPPGLAEFGKLHAAYSTLDLLTLAIGAWMAIALVRIQNQRQ